MSANVTLIDYGAGNLLSVARAFEHCGAQVTLAQTADAIRRAERVVLPGVGAFEDGMAGLRDRGLVDAVREFASTGKPLLGICLGMQMLATVSEEFGEYAGLDLIPGRVRAIPRTGTDGKTYKVPHVGWSTLERPNGASWKGTPLQDLPEGSDVYLVHSYHLEPAHSADELAYASYRGNRICVAVRRGQVFGCQFHPEKSGRVGLTVVSGFLSLGAG